MLGEKYSLNNQMHQGDLMIFNQNKKENVPQIDSNSSEFKINEPENQGGDASGCSFVSRFIGSQKSGYMETPFGNNRSHSRGMDNCGYNQSKHISHKQRNSKIPKTDIA